MSDIKLVDTFEKFDPHFFDISDVALAEDAAASTKIKKRATMEVLTRTRASRVLSSMTYEGLAHSVRSVRDADKSVVQKEHRSMDAMNRVVSSYKAEHRDRVRKNAFNYNDEYQYVGDVEHPTLFEKQLKFTEDPLWYNLIRTTIFILIILLCCDVPDLRNFRNALNAFFCVIYFLYAIDLVVSFLTQHVLHIVVNEPNPVQKPVWVFFLEVVAIIPIEYFVFSEDIWFFLRTKSVLLIVRLVYEYLHDMQILDTTMLARTWQMMMASTCLRLFLHSLVHNLLLMMPSMQFFEIFDLMGSLNHIPNLEYYQKELPIIVCIYFDNILVIMPSICLLKFTYTLNHLTKYQYINHVHMFRKVLVPRYKISEVNAQRVLDYMKMRWEQRANHLLLEEMLAERICFKTTYETMAYDRHLIALQHCPMLRDHEYYVLRYLAQLVQPKYYLKDKYLFKSPMHKHFMVYIASGCVDVLSQEDGEARIIRLTEGTCVGSMSLVYPYRASSNFRTSTPCAIYELHAKDFTDFARLFPEQYRSCLKYLKTKINQAVFLSAIKKANDPKAVDNNIIWLKGQLHRFMGMKAVTASDHKVSNIYLSKGLHMDPSMDVLYTKTNMEMLCIQPRDSQYNDSVFIKQSCIWIFHPDSPLLTFMQKVMFVVSVLSYCMAAYLYALIYIGIKDEPYFGYIYIILYASIFCQFIEVLLRSWTPVNLHVKRTLLVMFAARCAHLGFVCDVISLLWSIANVIFTFPPYFFFIWCLRLWRLRDAFIYIETNIISNVFLFQMIFYMAIYLFVWYNVGLLFIFINGSFVRVLTYDAIMFTIGQGYYQEMQKQNVPAYWFTLPTYLLNVMRLIVFACVSSGYHLKMYDEIVIASTLASTKRYISYVTAKKRNLSMTLRLRSFLTLLINDHYFMRQNALTSEFRTYPDYIKLIVKPEHLLKFMRRSKFFSNFPLDLVKKMAVSATMEVFYENAVILTRGALCGNLVILINGHVAALELDKVHRISPGSDLNMLEMVYSLPTVRNFVAFSHAITANIPYKLFIESLKKFPKEYRIFTKASHHQRQGMVNQLKTILYGKPIVVVEVDKKDTQHSCFPFKCIMYRDSFEAYDFFPAFEQLGIFSFVRFLLMRLTFHPEGKFLLIWEGFRVYCASLAVIFFLIPSYLFESVKDYILVLDFVGYLDIYIRLHVCYYNSEGILVKHPLRTARNYFFGAFIVDLLSVLPLQFYSNYTVFKTFIRACRIIQLYRVFGYQKYKFNAHFSITVLGIAYSTIVIVVAISTLVFELDCPGSTIHNLKCQTLDTKDPVTSYLRVVLAVTAGLTGTFIYVPLKIKDMNNWASISLSSACLFGVFWRSICLAKTFNNFWHHDVRINKASTEIRKLVNFIRGNKLPKALVQHVYDYFDIYWQWYDCFRTQHVLANMNASLRRDFLFHLYGDPFIRFNMFTSDYRSLADFFKNLFLLSSSRICPTYGKFINLNDVDNSIYLLYRGVVEITDAEGEVLITLLPGAIFGNLTNLNAERLKISASARCNSQCMVVESSKLLEILESFPKIRSHYYRATAKKKWFIKSKAKTFEVYENLKPSLKRCLCMMKFFTSLQSFFVFYIGNLLNFYQIATGEDNFFFLITLYALDGMHVIGEFMKYLMPVKNEYGHWCTKINDIFMVKATKTSVIMGVLTSLPFDVVFFLQPNYPMRTYYFSLLRLNRPLRIYYIIANYLDLMSQCGSKKIIWKKTAIIFYEVLYIAVFVTMIYAVVDPIATRYEYKAHLLGTKIPIEDVLNLRTLDSSLKFKYYTYYAYFSFLFVLQESDYRATAEPPIMQTLTIGFLIFSFVMYTLILCQLYDIISDVFSRQAYIGTIMFNTMLKFSNAYSLYIKRRFLLNARYVFSKDNNRSMRALNGMEHPIYLREMILNLSYGNFLLQHPILRNCHADFLRQVARELRVVDLPKGFEIIHKYDQLKSMYFLIHGSVVVLQEDGDILQNYLYQLYPGDCFCFQLGLNVQKQAAYTYTCKESSLILELRYTDWERLIPHFPATEVVLSTACEEYMDDPYIVVPVARSVAKRFRMKHFVKEMRKYWKKAKKIKKKSKLSKKSKSVSIMDN